MTFPKRLKTFPFSNGSEEQPKTWDKIAARARSTFKERWILLIFLLIFVAPFSALKTLAEDGIEVFASQKDALILEVFARTDLEAEAYPLLEESLRVMSGIREVIAISPQESLKKVMSDPKLGIDPGWLEKKSQDSNDTILPWSYNLHLAAWDENSLKTVIGKIEDLQVGRNKVKAVSEIHYDKERWALAFALYNYVRWIKRTLTALLCASFAAVIILAFKVRNRLQAEPELLYEGAGFLTLGLAGGILSHGVQLAILSVSFFPESFSWNNQIGHGLVFQIALSVLLSFSAFGVWAIGKTA